MIKNKVSSNLKKILKREQFYQFKVNNETIHFLYPLNLSLTLNFNFNSHITPGNHSQSVCLARTVRGCG